MHYDVLIINGKPCVCVYIHIHVCMYMYVININMYVYVHMTSCTTFKKMLFIEA